jgi:two-component system LytT family response regulator
MDIELEDGNAFDLLQSLPEIPFKIIFITAFNEHAIRAIKFSALDYLLKPVDEAELTTSLNKIRRETRLPATMAQQVNLVKEHLQFNHTANRIALRDQYHLRIVIYDDILYCQSDNGYTTFHLTDGRQVVVCRSIKEHERLLPPAVFLRIHQSYIVNSKYVELYHKEGYVVLKNGSQLPVSVRKREGVVRSLTGY